MAKTSLAQQLELLKTPQTSVHRETKGSVSLLYDFFDAKSIDSNTHFSVALDGLEGLIKLDYSAARFKENLFHESSKNLDRTVMTAEENSRLDECIEEYLYTVVSKYFQITDTMKTMEWLVYRYKVHMYNVDAYVGSVLPYHGTRQFARVLQTVSKIKDPSSVRWYWLKQVQMQAVPLSINVLVTHCSAKPDFFRYIIDQIFKAIEVDQANVRFASFLVMMCVKMLEHSQSETVVALVVSSISKSLRKYNPIYYSPACIVLSHLSSLVKLENSVLMKFLELISRCYPKEAANKTFLALNIICKTQDLDHFPHEFLSGAFLHGMFDWIVRVQNCDSLVRVLFGTLIHFAGDERFKHENMLKNVEKLLENKAITRCETIHGIVQRINEALEKFDSEEMEQDGENVSKTKAEEFLKKFIRFFEQYYPLALDSAIVELESSTKISELLNSFRFSQIEKYNVPLFVGLEHSSSKVRRSSLLFLVKNFKNYINPQEKEYIRCVLKQKFFDDFQTTSVDILLQIFSVNEQIFNLFSAEEYEKIAFKLVHFCEYNLAAKRQDENGMEVDQNSDDNAKWFQLKKKLLETFFSKKFQEYYLEDPHFVAQSLFFVMDSRFRLVNFLFPSNEDQYDVCKLMLSSPFGKSHPVLKSIKIEDKTDNEINFERICWKNFNALSKFIENNLDVILDKDNLKNAVDSTLEEYSDSYRRSLMFLNMLLSHVFQESSDNNVQQTIGSTILECFDFIIHKFPLAKISKKTLFNMFQDIPDDCFQSCLRQNSFFECSKIPTTTIVFILHSLISSYKFVLKNSWSTIHEESGQELVAYKVFKMLTFLSKNRDICPSKHTFGLFESLFEYFLNKIVSSQSDIFSFFLPIIINANFDAFRLEVLSILNGLIQKDELRPRFVDSLSNERKTLIGHLLALASNEQSCRQAVISNLELLHAHLDPKKDAYVFIKDLFQSKNEMILDHKLLPKTFANMHRSPDTSHKFVEHIVNDIHQEFFNGSLPIECRCLVITLFTNFNDSSRDKIFKFYYETYGDFGDLNPAQEQELKALLGYFVQSNDHIFDKSDSFSVKLYLNVLSTVEKCLSADACLTLLRAFEQSFRTMSEKNFKLAMEIARKMIEMELRLSENVTSNMKVKSVKLISWLRKSIRSVLVNGKFTAALMKDILDIEKAANSFSALVKETPSKKKSKVDSTELIANYIRRWKLLRILVGCIQFNQTFNDSPILIKCLFDYFRLTFSEACDASIMEQTRQIFLYAISHMIEIELGTTSDALEEQRKRKADQQGPMERVAKKEKKTAKNSKQVDEHDLFLKQIDIQVIVDCLSESRLQDTQKIALLTLSLLAPHFYIQILDSLVAIFTYIGTSLLQCDDQYSLAILYETIESIIPMILEKSGDKTEERKHYILSIFLDSFNDVPAYRRLVLFTKLIHLLGSEKFLSFFTVLLFERKYLRFENAKNDDRDGISALVLSLFQAFPIDTQIRSLCAVLSVFESKFFELIFSKVDMKFDRKTIKKLEANCVAKEFKLKLKTEAHQFACGVDLLKFVSDLVSNLEFRFAVNCLFNQTPNEDSDDEMETDQAYEVNKTHLESLTYLFHLLIEMIVSLEPKDEQVRSSSLPFRRQVRTMLEDILTNFNQLFPATEILKLIINNMLKNSYSVDKELFIFVQRRALRLMYEKLSALDVNELTQFETLRLLKNLLNELPISFKSIEKNRELILNTQHLMLAFKACFKFVNDSEPKTDRDMDLLKQLFEKTLTFTESIQIERKRQSENDKNLSNLKGSCLICLVEVLCAMTTDGIEHIGQVISLLLDNFTNDDEIILIANLTSVSKLIAKFGQFLSPYMPKILLALLPAFEWADRDLGVKSRLQTLWTMLSQDVPKRVLFDAVSKAYEPSTKISPKAVIELMNLLKNSCANLNETDILIKSFRALMLDALNYRAQNIGSVNLKTIELVEMSIGDAFSAFFPKLNESQFRPLFFKLHSAALKIDANKDPANEQNKYCTLKNEAFYKMIAFYRFCSQLADTLKSLFCVFVAPLILKNAAEMLSAYHSSNNNDNGDDDNEDDDDDDDDDDTRAKLQSLAEGPKLKITDESIGEPLIASILATFSKCFLYDLSGAFVKDDSINKIIKPLIHQISNINGTPDDYDRRIELILECTQYLIQNNKDETLIKEFNYQILLKTREQQEKVRIAAIRVLHRLILTCAEEYLSFIPEAIPFISEMCEDHSDAVETIIKKVIIDIEQLVGEPIKKYL